MTAVLQLKTRILGKLEAVYFLYRFSHSKGLAQLSVSPVQSHSPVPQSSPESSPPNRDGPVRGCFCLLCYNGDIIGHLKGSLSTVSTTNAMLAHCKSQEVNGIVIILNKTSHAPSLTLQVHDFQAVVSSYCLCSKQLYAHYRYSL